MKIEFRDCTSGERMGEWTENITFIPRVGEVVYVHDRLDEHGLRVSAIEWFGPTIVRCYTQRI